MNSESKENGEYESTFSSHDCIDIICDGPGDNTIRPLTGERLKRALAEREKMERYKAMGFESDGQVIDVICDGPGDTTVRPLTGETLKRAIAEREKMERYRAMGFVVDEPGKRAKKDG